MSDFLTREMLLKRRTRRTKIVTISPDHPEQELAGKKITVRAMNARERSDFEAQFSHPKTGKLLVNRAAEIRERLVIATVMDEAGNSLLSDEDLVALREVDAAILEAVAKASQELNDISEDDLKELEKNLPKTQSGFLPTN